MEGLRLQEESLKWTDAELEVKNQPENMVMAYSFVKGYAQ